MSPRSDPSSSGLTEARFLDEALLCCEALVSSLGPCQGLTTQRQIKGWGVATGIFLPLQTCVASEVSEETCRNA